MTSGVRSCDAVIVGAGAAGLMCALTAAQRGKRVVVFDHADKAGAKILISGGGRCNFTNLDVRPERFISQNPHFCRSALSRYTAADFITLVEKHGIAYHEKTLGQLFCDGSARAIVAMLLDECAASSAEVHAGAAVTSVSRTTQFRVETTRGVFEAPALVLATGGLSIPKMGATGWAYDVARQFGLRVTECRPGLVPLKLSAAVFGAAEHPAGVALPAIASCGAARFRENLLFTHRGLSGPAILQISSYWQELGEIALDLLPEWEGTSTLIERKRARPLAEAKTILSDLLPARLAHLLASAHLPSGAIGTIPDRLLADFTARLKSWKIVPSGSEGYAKAEVTLGGIDTRDLSSKTMASTAVPGLYCIGEAVDVTGWLGGYNFQWAWSSGWCAGVAIAEG
jgi:predicted Rossmann fold flavoprotein